MGKPQFSGRNKALLNFASTTQSEQTGGLCIGVKDIVEEHIIDTGGEAAPVEMRSRKIALAWGQP